MTGPELKSIRQKLGLSRASMGLALGYRGNPNSRKVALAEYERETRPIPPWIERLAWMYGRYGVPEQFIE